MNNWIKPSRFRKTWPRNGEIVWVKTTTRKKAVLCEVSHDTYTEDVDFQERGGKWPIYSLLEGRVLAWCRPIAPEYE